MAAIINTITFDCGDAAGLARFWAEVTGWEVGPGAHKSGAVVGGPRRPDDCPSLMFIKVPEGKSAKNPEGNELCVSGHHSVGGDQGA